MTYYVVEQTRTQALTHEYEFVIKLTNVIEYIEIRRWLTQIYGPSGYINQVQADSNEHWALSIEQKEYCVYLKGDAELMMFRLRWGIA